MGSLVFLVSGDQLFGTSFLFHELPTFSAMNPFQLLSLPCWFLSLKTRTPTAVPLIRIRRRDRDTHVWREEGTASHMSLRWKTNSHPCIQRYINCQNWTDKGGIISFGKRTKPSWSPNEAWLGFSLASWLETDAGWWGSGKTQTDWAGWQAGGDSGVHSPGSLEGAWPDRNGKTTWKK